MPNIKSAKKRVLVNTTKNMQNKMFKSAFRTQLKSLEAEKNAENLQKAYALIDKAAESSETTISIPIGYFA